MSEQVASSQNVGLDTSAGEVLTGGGQDQREGSPSWHASETVATC